MFPELNKHFHWIWNLFYPVRYFHMFLEWFSKLCKHFHIVSRAGCAGSNASYWAPLWDSPSMSEIATKIILLAPGTFALIISLLLRIFIQNSFCKYCLLLQIVGLKQNLCPFGQTNWIPPLESNYPLLLKKCLLSSGFICRYEREINWDTKVCVVN